MKRSRVFLLSVAAAAFLGAGDGSPAGIRTVPSQYPSIQAAIDAAVAGDTVLVSHGTYYENIRFRGKAITVASYYILDGDTAHIDSTVIDGSRPAFPDSGSTVFFVAGEDTNSVLCGMTITGGTGSITPEKYRVGGGLLMLGSSGARICHNRIISNTLTHQNVAIGAGVVAGSPYEAGGWLILEENEISHNTATGTNGVGSVGVSCGMNGRIERNHIEENQGFSSKLGGAGGGMYCWTEAPGTKDLVVRKNIISGNKFTSTGVNEYGESGLGGGLAISGFRAIVEGNVITNNELDGPGICAGGGVLLNYRNDELQFCNNWISGNRLTGGGQHWGGGVCIWRCSPKFYNNIVVDNTGKQGGGVYVGDGNLPSRPRLLNNTICGNSATLGSGIYSTGSYPVVLNSIMWNDSAEIHSSGGLVTVLYSDVRGGWAGTGNIEINPAFLDTTTYRLSDSSRCIGAGRDSVRIEDTWYRAPRTCFYGSPRPCPEGSHPDIGACENPLADPAGGVTDPTTGLPMSYALNQNYPNPFNPTTVVRYELPAACDVKLVVYDLLGREVATLVNDRKSPGSHEAKFDGARLASGVYLYRLTAGDFVQTHKMLLVQ